MSFVIKKNVQFVIIFWFHGFLLVFSGNFRIFEKLKVMFIKLVVMIKILLFKLKKCKNWNFLMIHGMYFFVLCLVIH